MVYDGFILLKEVLVQSTFFVRFIQGVESERCASFQAAMDVGHPVKIDAIQSLTLADGMVSDTLFYISCKAAHL